MPTRNAPTSAPAVTTADACDPALTLFLSLLAQFGVLLALHSAAAHEQPVLCATLAREVRVALDRAVVLAHAGLVHLDSTPVIPFRVLDRAYIAHRACVLPVHHDAVADAGQHREIQAHGEISNLSPIL